MGTPPHYGYPGDGINAFLGAFERVGGDPQFTQTRHEEMAAFMACAHAKFTGAIGTCMATSGPGAIHLASLFHSRFSPRLLTDMTLRRFGLSACTANPEGQPPSLAQHGS